MRYQGLILVFATLLPQCSLRKSEAVPSSVPSGERLDPSLYTVTAYVMGSEPFDNTTTGIQGRWLDGQGEFVPGDYNRMTRFRYVLTPDQRSRDLQFTMSVGEAKATSGLLNFKDCDFADTLGYSRDEYRHMIVNYNFYPRALPKDEGPIPDSPEPTGLFSQGTLERAPLGSSGPDDVAVRCEQIETRRPDRFMSVRLKTSLANSMKMKTQGQIVVPKVLSRESFNATIDQEFVFEMPGPPAESKVDIDISSVQGNLKYQLTFNRCLALLNGPDRNLLISQHAGLYLDEDGILREGGDLSCCLSNGTCLGVTYGLTE